MGLDFGQSEAHWAYSGFNNFRRRLAACLGFDLDSMEGFGGDRSWDDIVQDDLLPLLDHSDCDGVLTPDECAKVGPRLRSIVAPWPDDYDKEQALLLADGMDWCVKNNHDLEFC